MFSQSADQPAADQSPAPIGMRELPPQPAKPVMPAYATSMSAPTDDGSGPGPDDSVIARDDHLEGTFTSRGTVRVLGSVKGRIEAVRVRIEDGAHVDADVIVDEAIIAGEFTGNLTCRERLEARASGRINGRVETHKLMLHEGASVEGEMHMITEPARDASETIRGTAPIRGETKPDTAGEVGQKPDPTTSRSTSSPSTPTASPSPTGSTPSGDRAAASSSTAATPNPRSTATARAVVAQLASRPESTVTVEAKPEGLRLTPRATTAAGNGTRNGNGSTSGSGF